MGIRLLLLALCLILMPEGARAEEAPPRYRALLISCDEFVTAADMAPIGRRNLDMMETILSQDARGFAIYRQYGITTSAEALEAAVRYAFADAQEGDVSLLYLHTHGEFDATYNNPEAVLLLSDGAVEARITAQALRALLDTIPGTKLMLVDACHSGALIGKGLSPAIGPSRVTSVIEGGDYRALVSSGASEPSWYWRETSESAPVGSSYFTTALALGAGYLGRYAADANRDGTITLGEMYRYLWTNHASSAVQMLPQDDAFPLIVYDGIIVDDVRGELGNFVFQSTQLDPENPLLTFSYTAMTATRVAYQITWLEEGRWDWQSSELLMDETDSPTGDVTPGRKQISLDLSEILPEGWSYAMIHVMTQGSDGSDRLPFLYASRVLSARHSQGDPELSLQAAATFRRSYRREMSLFVAHAIPVNLTVTIHDEVGQVVRRLSISKPSRPEGLSPAGSLFYWDGMNDQGMPVPAGRYRAEAYTRLGGQAFRAECWVNVQ
ncbi:MAG: caspase family protein [Oscillospiraceae bacterium]|nr:caspase family protein [Oscillospiraceae bacterium]